MNQMSTTERCDFSSLRVDLHSHTKCSDGALTPIELVNRAVNFQIDVLAITDHDTVAALDIANQYIKKQNLALRLINGIEISTAWQGFDIHIVGLNIIKDHPSMTHLIELQQVARQKRAIMIDEKLQQCGIFGVLKEAKQRAGEGSITRAHFAQVMLERGIVTTQQKAFDKYLGKGNKAFVKPNWCSVEEAIAVIHQAGGTAVMAHPIRYDLSAKWLRRLIVDFKNARGDALETVLPQMNNEQRQRMLNYCLEYDLHSSLGSDFHRPSKWIDLGRKLTLPEKCKPVWQMWQT